MGKSKFNIHVHYINAADAKKWKTGQSLEVAAGGMHPPPPLDKPPPLILNCICFENMFTSPVSYAIL